MSGASTWEAQPLFGNGRHDARVVSAHTHTGARAWSTVTNSTSMQTVPNSTCTTLGWWAPISAGGGVSLFPFDWPGEDDPPEGSYTCEGRDVSFLSGHSYVNVGYSIPDDEMLDDAPGPDIYRVLEQSLETGEYTRTRRIEVSHAHYSLEVDAILDPGSTGYTIFGLAVTYDASCHSDYPDDVPDPYNACEIRKCTTSLESNIEEVTELDTAPRVTVYVRKKPRTIKVVAVMTKQHGLHNSTRVYVGGESGRTDAELSGVDFDSEVTIRFYARSSNVKFLGWFETDSPNISRIVSDSRETEIRPSWSRWRTQVEITVYAICEYVEYDEGILFSPEREHSIMCLDDMSPAILFFQNETW